MIAKYGVAVIPVSVFYDADRSARGAFCFAKKDETLREALRDRGGAVAAGTDRAMTLANWQTIEFAAFAEDQIHPRGHLR
jgi:hypothetical protein